MPKFTQGEDSIIYKIKSLMNTAESYKELGNLEAAEAATAKANELLLKHNIDLHKIRMAQANDNDKFADWIYGEYVSYKENLAGNRWRMDLIKMVCNHNLTGVIFNINETFRVYGLAENVEVTVWLYNFLGVHLMRLAKEFMAGLDPGTKATQCRHTWLKNFLLGAIEGVDNKLSAQRQESTLAKAIWKLILYNEKSLLEYKQKVEPGFITVNPKSIELTDGYANGLEAGKNVELNNRRLTAEKQVEKKLLK